MNLLKRKMPTHLLLLSLFLILLIFSSSSSAKACKEMSQNACNSSDNCTWVKGYTTKKGSKINAYCRNKPKKSSSNKSTPKTTDTKKDQTSKGKKKSTESKKNQTSKDKKKSTEPKRSKDKKDKKDSKKTS